MQDFHPINRKILLDQSLTTTNIDEMYFILIVEQHATIMSNTFLDLVTGGSFEVL